jgi:hypothetical protein
VVTRPTAHQSPQRQPAPQAEPFSLFFRYQSLTHAWWVGCLISIFFSSPSLPFLLLLPLLSLFTSNLVSNPTVTHSFFRVLSFLTSLFRPSTTPQEPVFRCGFCGSLVNRSIGSRCLLLLGLMSGLFYSSLSRSRRKAL